MAYYLTGSKAYAAQASGVLKPLKAGQGLSYTGPVGGAIFVDALGKTRFIAEGHAYRITGARDGNGYVVTYANDTSTAYLTAEEGCKLC